MRIAIYGGSFNPPHVGHSMVAAYLKWTQQAEEVWWVPAFDHAFDKVLAPFELRVRLCEDVTRSLGSWARVSTIEATLPAPSYTIHTLDALHRQYPEHQFQWVAGADILETLHLWKEWQRIKEGYGLLLVGRAGYPEVPGVPTFPDISSTQIRELLKENGDVSKLVDAGILDLLTHSRTLFYSAARERSTQKHP